MIFRPSVLLLSWLVGFTVAYQLPGGYERVMFYYAYLMEISAYGEPKQIAPACSRLMGLGKTPCSYDQFVEYLVHKEPDKTGYTRITGGDYDKDHPPDVEDTAHRTMASGATGPVMEGRVVQGFKADGAEDSAKYAQLLQKVGRYINLLSLEDKVPTSMKTACGDALKGVIFARLDASTGEFEAAPANKGKRTVPKVERPVWSDHPEWGTVHTLNPGQYCTDNKVSKKELKTLWDDVVDSSHAGNIQVLKQAYSTIQESCSSV